MSNNESALLQAADYLRHRCKIKEKAAEEVGQSKYLALH